MTGGSLDHLHAKEALNLASWKSIVDLEKVAKELKAGGAHQALKDTRLVLRTIRSFQRNIDKRANHQLRGVWQALERYIDNELSLSDMSAVLSKYK